MIERYLLDTNIVLDILARERKLKRKVADILMNEYYNNMLYVSAISVREIIHLYRKKSIKTSWLRAEEIIPAIHILQ